MDPKIVQESYFSNQMKRYVLSNGTVINDAINTLSHITSTASPQPIYFQIQKPTY